MLAPHWHGHLHIRYSLDGRRTIAHDRHHGPLRVLQRLYPEGDAICHHVLVHPPGGVVGGDRLEVDVDAAAGTHAVLTTPGATRFYRSEGAWAEQTVRLAAQGDARLEWLPMETIAYRGCRARNRVELALAPGAQAMGWDVLALGLPAAGEPFDRGEFEQHLACDGHWLERGRIDAADTRLLQGPLGLDGRSVLATMWFAAGAAWPGSMRDALLDDARTAIDAAAPPLATHAGATAPHGQVVVLRALAHRVEPVMALLRAVRAAWRGRAWQLAPAEPRVWRT